MQLRGTIGNEWSPSV